MSENLAGNLYGEITDARCKPLADVTVTLSGSGPVQVQVTNTEGQFRFPGLAPGSYGLTAELDGFAIVEYSNVAIRTGRNAKIEITLSITADKSPDNPAIRKLKSGDLAKGIGAITRAIGAFLAESAAVCLDRHGHLVGVELIVKGDFDEPFKICWEKTTDSIQLSRF